MTKVSRDQFEFVGDTGLRHKPTGATFSTYQYVDPNDAASSMTVNAGRAGERLQSGEEYAIEDLLGVAHEMLRERALAGGSASE